MTAVHKHTKVQQRKATNCEQNTMERNRRKKGGNSCVFFFVNLIRRRKKNTYTESTSNGFEGKLRVTVDVKYLIDQVWRAIFEDR
jgi:hypothetical protein